jgi:glycosyltransferase involved in cell wall biosynthesis
VKTLCVEGWRGVNHSIAMVNQYQLLEMLRQPGWTVYHRDAPWFMPHWKPADLDSGFAPEARAAIAALAEPPVGTVMDCVFRIASPIRPPRPGEARRTLTFMVTEFGLGERSFDPPGLPPTAWTSGEDFIVTPTRWSRDRLADHGFDPARIHVVPHGFREDIFTPMAPAERAAARAQLGIGEGETLFTNVGVSTWNKGLDLLLLAFARLRDRGLPVRLILKDHKALYGVGVEGLIANLAQQVPLLGAAHVTAGISVLSSSLNLPQLRQLYAISDAYVSPYRAEGFNMPVLEALGCGTAVITTAGGATDDFVPHGLVHRIASRPGTKEDAPQVNGRFVVPDLDDLTEAMARIARGERPDEATRRAVRARLAESFSWSAVTGQLMRLA